MIRKNLKLLAVLVALALLLTLAPTASAQTVRLRATLDATVEDPGASGSATFEVTLTTLRMRLSVDVADIASADLAVVLIDGEFAGMLEIDAGAARLDLDTDLGDAVVMVALGATIEILDAVDARVLLSGTFGR